MTPLDNLSDEEIARLARVSSGRATLFDALWLAPWKLMETPEPWQKQALKSIVTHREPTILNCCRQSGKTEVVSLAAYLVACLGGFVVVVSPGERQSTEFHRRLLGHHYRHKLCRELESPNKHELWLNSGGRVLALPNNEATLRGYAKVDLLVVDEASRVGDALFAAASPMLRRSRGRMVILSTPFGQRGFFYKEWTEGCDFVKIGPITADDCRKWLDPADVERDRRLFGDAWVEQEMHCKFLSMNGNAFFDSELFENLTIEGQFGEAW
jgi:hypothetical protein